LTISGLDLNCGHGLPNIDRLIAWAEDHAKRHKRKPAKPEPSQKDRAKPNGAGTAEPPPWEGAETSSGGHTLDEIDQLVQGPLPLGIDRSAEFARVCGHFHGCNWKFEELLALLEANPNGVAQKYDGRLAEETKRIWDKFEAQDAEAEAEAGAATEDDEGLFNAKADKAEAPPAAPLTWLKLSEWDHRILPEREWEVHERLPRRVPVLFSGPGGAGKGTVGLQLAAAKALGKEWLGTQLETGPAVCVDCEDEWQEMLRRLGSIRHHYDVKFADLERNKLHAQSWAADSDTVLAIPDRRGNRIVPTKLFGRLREAVGDIKPRIVVIASSANVFAGNEIDCAQVQQFMKLLSSLCHLTDCTLVLISHPSVRGLAEDTGLSGSTAWDSGVRARMYLKPVLLETGQPDPLRRELVFKKNQYAVLGETIPLEYRNGLWLPPAPMSAENKAATESACEAFILRMVPEHLKRGNRLSPSQFSPVRYAPKVLAREKEAVETGFTQPLLAAALDRLLRAGKLRTETVKRTGGMYLVIPEGQQ
jgi:RecA-family ATPase